MASKRLTNATKVTIFLDWLNSATNRQDVLYFMQQEMKGPDLVREAFGKGLLILYTPVDDTTGKITFVDLLT